MEGRLFWPQNSKNLSTKVLPSIGRVTKGLLLNIAITVDIVEPVTKFTSTLVDHPGIGQIFPVGLEAWTPNPETRYDLIWNQWCLGHLTDSQLLEYFQKCGKMLSDNGWIVVKENLSTRADGLDLFDELDSCVTRCVKAIGL
jgi:protein N-terminal methyltransferase